MVSLGLAEGAILTSDDEFFYAGSDVAGTASRHWISWMVNTDTYSTLHTSHDGSAHRGSDEPIPGLPVVPGHAGVGYGSRGLGDGASPYVCE